MLIMIKRLICFWSIIIGIAYSGYKGETMFQLITKRFRFVLLLMICLGLSGCGNRASADKLVDDAKSKYGDCEVVSKSETSDRVEVIVRDKAQGFEYKLSSKMDDIYIDGSKFGSVPSSSDTFYSEFAIYTMKQGQMELDNICKKYDVEYESLQIYFDEMNGTTGFLRLTIPMSVSEEQGKAIAEQVAKVFQQYNVNNRMDGFQIRLYHDYEWFKENYGTYNPYGENDYPAETYSSSGMSSECYIGMAQMPECKFAHK